MNKLTKYEALKRETNDLKSCISYITECVRNSRAESRSKELRNGNWAIRHELCPVSFQDRFEDLMYDLTEHYQAALSKRLEKLEAIETLLDE